MPRRPPARRTREPGWACVVLASLVLTLGSLQSWAGSGSHTPRRPSLEEILPRIDRLERSGSYREALDLLGRARRDGTQTDVRIDLLRGRLYRLMDTPESRLRSAQAIRRALHKNPRSALANLEMALTCYEQTFYGEARSYFKRALDKDPTLAQARFYLGLLMFENWRKLPEDSYDLNKASREFREAARYSPDDAAILYRLAVAQYFQKDYPGAQATLEHLIELKNRHADAYLLLGLIHHLQGNLQMAESYYKRGIGYQSVENKKPFRDIGLFMGEWKRARFEKLDPLEQRERKRLFWLERDPTPVTPINERRLDHYKRCVQADLLYAVPRLGLRGWDTQRGRVYIKYGPPLLQLYSLGGRLTGAAWIWLYPEVDGEPMRFVFLNEFLNGNYIFPIMEGDSRENYENYERVHELYEYETEITQFPTTQEASQFRGVEGLTRVEIDSAIPKHSSVYGNLSISPDPGNALQGTFILYDQAWREIDRKQWGIPIEQMAEVDLIDSTYELTSVGLDLSPGAYRYVIHYADTLFRTEGFERGEIEVRSFESPFLEISDLLMANDITYGERSPVFQKGPLSVIPNPLGRARRGSSLGFYYEIYNLTPDPDGTSHFMVTYAISTPKALHPEEHFDFFRQFKDTWAKLRGRAYSESPLISGTTRQSRLDEHSQEYLYVDSGRLVPGEYVLLLEVKDLESGETATREREFRVVR